MKACERCGAFGPNLTFFDRFGVENEDANFLDLVRSCRRCTQRAQSTYVRRRVVAAYENHNPDDSYWERTLITSLLSCGHVVYVNGGFNLAFNLDCNPVSRVVPCAFCTK